MANTTPTVQPSELNTEAMRRLYDGGLNDTQIAAELGISRRSVWTWRQAVGLPAPSTRRRQGIRPKGRPAAAKRPPAPKAAPAPRKRGPRIRLDEAAAMAAYTAGKTDREIAEERGCTANTIANWRKRMGFPPNRPQRPSRAHTYELPAAAVNARAREAGLTYGQYQALEYEAAGRPPYRKRAVPRSGTGKE